MRFAPVLGCGAVLAAEELAEIGNVLESAGTGDGRGRELGGEESLGDLLQACLGDFFEDRCPLEVLETEVGQPTRDLEMADDVVDPEIRRGVPVDELERVQDQVGRGRERRG